MLGEFRRKLQFDNYHWYGVKRAACRATVLRHAGKSELGIECQAKAGIVVEKVLPLVRVVKNGLQVAEAGAQHRGSRLRYRTRLRTTTVGSPRSNEMMQERKLLCRWLSRA